ncbi:MAG: ectonucleotide pyrophosphatase/phosphodiesterase, partial [Luteimonas sp.]
MARSRALAIVRCALVFCAGLLWACTGPGLHRYAMDGASVPMGPRSVLLVSLDGFRAGDLDRGLTPVLSRLATDGVRAEWLTPSYPSLTFPNHYTMVTGLRPDRHGIIHNTMRDDGLGTFKLSNREAVGDGRWWQGEPIWVAAERAGLRTATLFWPGSEAAVGGIRPTRW